jgi:valyl-tRNA synthetase
MSAMESQGRDVKMDEKRVEGYRNFATKLWNAARFCQSNGIGGSASVTAPQATSAVNKWIIGEVVETVALLDQAMADLRFDAAANTIYHFVWDAFCDWYIELIKGSFDEETKAVCGWVLDQILVMLHPFMPFVTEELWNALAARPYELIVAQWPQPGVAVDAAAKAEVEWLISLVTAIRSGRNELNVPPGMVLPIKLAGGSKGIALERVVNNRAILKRMAKVEYSGFGPLERTNDFRNAHWDSLAAEFSEEVQKGSLFVTADDFEGFIPLEGVIDIAAEKGRLEKALAVSEKEAKSLEGRLSNPAFVEKAKPEAVEKARADHALHAAEAERLRAALARLG